MKKKFYYNEKKNVLDYIRMAEPYNGKVLIEKTETFLTPGASILELGMGPGKDMDQLSLNYKVTGSDLSKEFIDMYKEKNPAAEAYILDAHSIKTDQHFDCIFSNKVLHHLSKKELSESIKRQYEILNARGIVIHSFWEGDREDILSGLRFVYYRKNFLESMFAESFEILCSHIYSEVFPNDSVCIAGRKIN